MQAVQQGVNQLQQGVRQGVDEAEKLVQQVKDQTISRKGSVTLLIVIAILLSITNGILAMMSMKVSEIILAIITAVIGSILMYYCENKNGISLALVVSLILLCVITIIVFSVAEYTEEDGYSWVWRLVIGIPYFLIAIGMIMKFKSLCTPSSGGNNMIMPNQPVNINRFQKRRRVRRR